MPRARTGASTSGTIATTCSSFARPRYWSIRAPAASCTELPGTDGRSTGEKRTRRPVLVTAPMSPRVVVSTADRIASCFERRDGGTMPPDGAASGSWSWRSSARTIRPVADRKTRHGASAICSSVAVAAERDRGATGPPLSSRVRRGVPYVSAAASSSRATCARSRESLPSSSSRCAISDCSASRSASSSTRENLVSRRSRSSRMYSACASDRSNTSRSRVRACSASSDERMTWMTSSMSRIAISSPSTRCRRSLRRSRR